MKRSDIDLEEFPGLIRMDLEDGYWKAYGHAAYLVQQRRPELDAYTAYIEEIDYNVPAIAFPISELHAIFREEEIELSEEGGMDVTFDPPIDRQAYKEWAEEVTAERPWIILRRENDCWAAREQSAYRLWLRYPAGVPVMEYDQMLGMMVPWIKLPDAEFERLIVPEMIEERTEDMVVVKCELTDWKTYNKWIEDQFSLITMKRHGHTWVAIGKSAYFISLRHPDRTVFKRQSEFFDLPVVWMEIPDTELLEVFKKEEITKDSEYENLSVWAEKRNEEEFWEWVGQLPFKESE